MILIIGNLDKFAEKSSRRFLTVSSSILYKSFRMILAAVTRSIRLKRIIVPSPPMNT